MKTITNAHFIRIFLVQREVGFLFRIRFLDGGF